VIAGPTASGKTELAVDLAEALNAEIISADSMQVYEDLPILTARPTPNELRGVPCHLSGHVTGAQQYHLDRFVREADRALEEIRSRGRRVIVCGGTGLYIRGWLKGIFEAPPAPPGLREELNQLAKTPRGLTELRSELARVDPAAHARIAPADRVRLVRAIEVWRTVGVPITLLQQQFERAEPRIPHRQVILDWEVGELDRRIESRARAMVRSGLLEEVRDFLDRGNFTEHPVYRALGAGLVVDHLEGRVTLEELIAGLTLQTRQYAKRQRTWFRREATAVWIPRAPSQSRDMIRRQVMDSLDCGKLHLL
jgi:tRNA dimethylallyltransferase